jgi:hypothetical protein
MRPITPKLVIPGVLLVAGIALTLALRESEDDNSASAAVQGRAPSEPPKSRVLISIQPNRAPREINPTPSIASVSNTISTNLGIIPKPIRANRSTSPTAPKGGAREVTDPWARVALASVGEDPDATAYWLDSINDPTVPPNERKDLIEDLNEDGFADPKHPNPDELPLIQNRLALLEAMAPWAMDAVNAAAIAEAYKDLIAMAKGLAHD